MHEIFLADKAGRLLHFYYDIPEAMDKDQKYNGGYTNATTGEDYVDHEWYPNPVDGESTVRTKLYERETTRMPADAKAKADVIKTQYDNQLEAEQNP